MTIQVMTNDRPTTAQAANHAATWATPDSATIVGWLALVAWILSRMS